MTRPIPITAMNGNFDFPPAAANRVSQGVSSSTTPSSSTNVPATSGSFAYSSTRLPSHRPGYNIGRGALSRELLESPNPAQSFIMPSEGSSERRRRRTVIRSINARRASTIMGDRRPTQSPSQDPSTARRPFSTLDDQYFQRQRLDRHDSNMRAIANLREAGARMAEVSSELRMLIDHDFPPDPLTSSLPALENTPSMDTSHRSKRRKVKHDSPDIGFKGFSYGRYGQLEPGKLKMEIVSCDGGHTRVGGVDHKYPPENVLKDDTSVYCTGQDTCNIILSHQGGTAFCLDQIVIKAPRTGYTMPVQEGLVFVSMTSEDLLQRTSAYRLTYSNDATLPSLQTSFGEIERNDLQTHPYIEFAQHDSTGRNITGLPPLNNHNGDTSYDEDSENELLTSAVDGQALAIPASGVTIDCALDDSDSDDNSPAAFAERRRQDRGMLALSRMLNAHSEGDEDQIEYGARWSTRLMTPDAEYPAFPPVRHRFPSAIRRVTPQSGDESSTLAPHTKFFIDSESNRCTIVFDPPLSGRFILLKLFSPAKNQNIDIQSILAYGYAGTRFFGAMELR